MSSRQFERMDRISVEIMKEVEKIIREKINDPRMKSLFSITHVEVTRDLRYAKIHISILEEESRDAMMKVLKKASGFIRRELGQNLTLRYIPELLFVLDTSIEYGVHISKVLTELRTSSEE